MRWSVEDTGPTGIPGPHQGRDRTQTNWTLTARHRTRRVHQASSALRQAPEYARRRRADDFQQCCRLDCSPARNRDHQIIQPWQFGENASKTTCLWLKNLPLLKPTCILQLPKSGRWGNQTPSGQNKLGPSKDRWKLRSATYQGIANAMASQWSCSSARPIASHVPTAASRGA